MILRANLRVGAEQITVETDSQEDFHKIVHLYREMASRVTNDAFIKVRTGDDHDYYEFYSPSLRAAKKISQSTKGEALVKDAPFYIGFKTPWVRFVFSKKLGKSVSFLMFDVITDDLREKGFKEPKMWYMAHMDGGTDPVLDNADVAMSPQQMNDYVRSQYED